MKKTKIKIISMLLTMCMTLSVISVTAFAANAPEQDLDVLADWGIAVPTPEESSAILYGDSGEYYIYPETSGSIPYVMVYYYDNFDSDEETIDFVVEMLEGKYEDLEIISGPDEVTIGDYKGYEVDMTYTIDGGYRVLDRRVVVKPGNRTYMFCSKEVEELDMTIDNLLYDTIADTVFLPELEDGTYDTSVFDTEDTDIEDIGEITDLPEISWEEFSEGASEEELGGRFEEIEEVGMKVFIPDTFEPMELTQDYKDVFFIRYFTEDPEAEIPAITVQYIDTIGFKDFSEYREFIEGLGEDYTDIIGEYMINGIHCLMYELKLNDNIVIGTWAEGGAVEFTIASTDKDNRDEIAEYVAASIQRTKPVDEASELPEGITATSTVAGAGNNEIMGAEEDTAQESEEETLMSKEVQEQLSELMDIFNQK